MKNFYGVFIFFSCFFLLGSANQYAQARDAKTGLTQFELNNESTYISDYPRFLVEMQDGKKYRCSLVSEKELSGIFAKREAKLIFFKTYYSKKECRVVRLEKCVYLSEIIKVTYIDNY